jgi:hypothetical protein
VFAALAAALLAAGQAAADVRWQTTHTTIPGAGFNSGSCGLESSSLRVSVHPAYLDVEEDAEISALGTVDAINDGKSLELTGTFTMPPGAAIIGALLWEGDKVLQGKLLDRRTADSLYENLVDRNSTPPVRPRDPLILTLTDKDTYQFKIYPVSIGHSRRIRLRYQLPPVLGADGVEMHLRAALAPLFAGAGTQVSVTFQGSGDVDKAVLLTKQDLRTQMTLPRTRLMTVDELTPTGGWDPYGGWILKPATRILPVDPLRQVALKTSFADGQMAGHYLNLYAGVTEDVLRGLGQSVEVVVLWKWQNTQGWARGTSDGYIVYTDGIWQAQTQAGVILDMYNNMGRLGTKIGLLHDDSGTQPHVFKAASRNEPAYASAVEYLLSVQGGYIEDFARKVRAPLTGKANVPAAVKASKNRFLSDLRLVKTLYSPATGVIRHLVLVTAGEDYASAETEMNAAFDSIFADQPMSVTPMNGHAVSQSGLDFPKTAADHRINGTSSASPWTTLPVPQKLNLNVVVRNAKNAYDFSIACERYLDYACGNLVFHGKSDSPWKDSLEWEALDDQGKPIGTAKTMPATFQKPNDTAVAVLWAGSGSAFSEKKELPLGPVYGFVDRWASLLALEKDSAKGLGDSGVPRIANEKITNVIPNYDGSFQPDPNSTGLAMAAKLGGLSDPASWKLERERGGSLLLRIPGLARGQSAEVELYDLAGKRAGYWIKVSGEGLLALDGGALRSGVYLLKVRISGTQAVKRIAI